MPTLLSVNINKIATLRNARGGNNPNVVQAAIDCQRMGANGITVHPRPDERHITYKDVHNIASAISTEFNIEGNPTEEAFVKLVLAVKPTQVTLVPDSQQQLTSNHGWDTIKHQQYLQQIIATFNNAGIRTSIFIDPQAHLIEAAATTGAHRIELYTEAYAVHYLQNPVQAIAPYIQASNIAHQLGLGINAGHDLDRNNLKYLADNIPQLAEVSIGHALICDALYLGLHNTIQLYKRCLNAEYAHE
jgi:pyridoxine 5-phosphate synthase